MSEVNEQMPAANGKGGIVVGSTLGKPMASGLAILLTAYTFGLAWSPAGRLFGRVVVAMTH
jgi:hypothetical protein